MDEEYDVSTSIQQRTLTLPQRPAMLTATGLIVAALLAGTAGIALLTSQPGAGTVAPRQALPIERPAFRGEMEFPGIEAVQGRQPGSGLRRHTPKGGAVEFAGLEPAPAAVGQALGGEQEFAGIR